MIQAPVPVAPGRRGSRLLSGLLVVAALVATGGLAFAIGRVSAPVVAAAPAGFADLGAGAAGSGDTAAGDAGANGFGDRNGFPGVRNAFGSADLTLRGTVAAISGQSLTLELASGSSVDIPLDGSTTYYRQAAAASSDVAIGGSVVVEVAGFDRAAGHSPNPNATPNPNPSASFGTARTVTLATE